MIAREISVIMPGWRLRTSGTAICKNGSPPYTKTIREKTGVIQALPGKAGHTKPQPSLDGLAEEQHRDGEGQRDPKAVAEHLLMTGMVNVTSMVSRMLLVFAGMCLAIVLFVIFLAGMLTRRSVLFHQIVLIYMGKVVNPMCKFF